MTDPVDLTNLRDMIGGDKEVEQELFAVFITSSDECIGTLKNNISEATDDEWRAQSHAWKGMSLNLGANHLADLCEKGQLHDNFTEEDKKALLAEMEEEYAKVKTFLNLS